ncbi:MAG TPA: TIGR01777 family oxidoreductase [Candidatus Sulfotelmatobacter sp.]
MINLRMARVLVSGSSGLIGNALIPALKTSGAHVVRLQRPRGANTAKPVNGDEQIEWDPEKPLSPEVVSGFDGVIHLAGESIMGRWSETKKAKIRNSRVTSTRNLAKALAQAADKPQVFMCGSAIGYYGNRGDELLREESAPGIGFLPDVCRQWEAATKSAFDAGIRTVNLRTGIVLSAKGGALAAMLTPFKLGVGGRIGSGRQWMSWIDMQDMVGGILHILKTDLVQGPVNLVSPRPVTNAEFTKTLAGVLSRPAIFPVPPFAVKLAFGEMGEELLLGGQRVEPAKLITSGYPFRFRELKSALQSITGNQ